MGTTRPRLIGINHVALEVGDLEAALDFYGSVFEFELRGRVPGMAFLEMGDQFLTIAEVASVMRVSKMTVYRLVHGGELPAVRVGRSFRVSEEDVNEYLRNSFFQTG